LNEGTATIEDRGNREVMYREALNEALREELRRDESVFIIGGGIASDIASFVQAEAFDYLDAPIEIVAGKNAPIPFNVHLEMASVPQENDIIEAVRKVLNITQ
jgi:pyruvate/2-oxoglutarate/acetoin dehydrogenase E1 component